MNSTPPFLTSTIQPSLPPRLPPSSLPLRPRARKVIFAAVGIALALAVGILTTAAIRPAAAANPVEIAFAHDADLGNTLRAMQVSAAIGDWEDVCRYIDLPALRSSLSEIGRQSLVASQQKGETDFIATMAGDFLVGVLLDKYVTEQTLPHIARALALAGAVAGEDQTPAANYQRHAYFVGPNLFVMGGEDPKKGECAYIIFRKDRDAGWRLAGLTNKKV